MYEKIVEDLNNTCNSNYRFKAKGIQDKIKARLNEGFKLDDFLKVHKIKAEQWLNNKDMNIYLRPETLYGNKFESYLNEYYRKYKNKSSDAKDYILCPACNYKIIGTISYCGKCGLETKDFKNEMKIQEAKEYIGV